MVKKLLMLLLPILGFVGGAIGGDLLHAPKTDEKAESAEMNGADEHGESASHAEGATESDGHAQTETKSEEESGNLDWFKFPNQFFVPIIRNGTPTAIMVLTLSIEIPSDARPAIEAQEVPLRDALLRALLIEANTGGFEGNFTAETSLERLRRSLLAAGRKVDAQNVKRILIEDIGRQEQ